MYIIVVLTPLSPPSVKISGGGDGGRASDLRDPESFGDEVDDALLRLEGPGDAEERGRVVGPTAVLSSGAAGNASRRPAEASGYALRRDADLRG